MLVYRNTWPTFHRISIPVHQTGVMWSVMFSAFSHSSWMMTQGKNIFLYSYLLIYILLLTQNYDKLGSIVYNFYFNLPLWVRSSLTDTLWIPPQLWRLVSTLLPTWRIFSLIYVWSSGKNMGSNTKIMSEPMKARTHRILYDLYTAVTFHFVALCSVSPEMTTKYR